MHENNDSKTKVAAGDGLILGLILSALSYLEYLTGVATGFILVLYIGGIVFFTNRYGKGQEIFGYGKSVNFGVLLSMFAYIILGLYTYLYASFIDPEEYLNRLEETLKLMKQGGFISGNENTVTLMQNPLLITVSYALTGIFLGLLVSLITSIFTKKK